MASEGGAGTEPSGRRELARRRIWNGWIAICATTAAVTVPAAFVLDLPSTTRIALELIFTVMFGVDALVTWRARDFASDSLLIPGLSRVSQLVVDLLAAAPFELLAGGSLLQILRVLKLQRVAQLFRLWRLNEIRRTAVLRLVFFLYWMALLTHWLACGWIALRGPAPDPGNFHRYVAGLYWCVTTLSTVGYGDVTPENDAQRLYAMATMMLGVGVYGFIIGNVATILAHIDPGRVNRLHRMEQLSTFMAYRNIPPALRDRIGAYYRHLWQRRLDHDETEILGRLPPGLRTDVTLFLKRDLLQAVPMFREAGDGFLREIALEMKPVVFMPGDHVIWAGDHGREMYFISRGTVDVLSPEDGVTVLNRLGQGDFFGEMALLENAPRGASVRAVDYCDLYRLDAHLFERILAAHPTVAAEIRAQAQARRSMRQD